MSRMPRFSPISLLLAASVAFALPIAAQGWVVPPICPVVRCPPCDPVACGRPCIMPLCPRRDPVVVRTSSSVEAALVDGVLRYEVRETFVNRGPALGEADYYFPLPSGAAFQDLKLSIGGQLVAGETMGASEARRIYEDIVRRQRDPALVEWMGHGLLHARIFPIAPGEEKTVVLRFQTVAPREGDAVRVDYVRGHARLDPIDRLDRLDRTNRPDREGRESFTLSYPAGGAWGTAYSPTHDLRTRERDGRRTVELTGLSRAITILVPMRRPSRAAISMLPYATGGEDGFALITLAPPAPTVRPGPRDVTFVVDVSGSMSGTKMEQARAAGTALLRTLSLEDRFRIIDFSSDVRTFRDDFVLASRESIAEAIRYVEALQAEGGTNIMGALREALRGEPAEGRLPLVLFVTDGEPTVGERSPDVIATEAGRLRRSARLFTFGLGADVNVSLVEQLALQGRGTAQFVRPEESVERAVSLVASRLTNPIVTDLRVSADGARLSRFLPSDASDLFAGQDLVLLARYSGSGRGKLRFEGRTPDGPVSWSLEVDFPSRARENSFVARLWATQRVGFLTAQRRKEANAEVDDEIRSLGERYGIPTPFTSYLVVEPGMAGRGIVPVMGSMMGGAGAAAPKAAQFESAVTAQAQRLTASLAMADAMAPPSSAAQPRRRDAAGRQMILRDSVWTDPKWSASATTIQVRAFSDAYFALLARIPELRDAASLGDRVRIAGRAVQIELGATGVERLTSDELSKIVRDW